MTGLVGWWPLNEDSGTTAYDLSGNGNHGESHLFRIRSTQAQLFDFQSRTSSPNTLVCNLDDSNGTSHTIEKEIQNLSDLEANKWTHGAVSYEKGGKMKVYIDGKEVDSKNVNNYPVRNFSNDAYTKNNGYNQAFRGYVQDIRVYRRALSNAEIQTIHEWGDGNYTSHEYHNGEDPGAVSRWKFDDDSDTSTAIDSWNNSDGTIVNGTSYNSDSVNGKSINLNSSNYIDTGTSIYPARAKTLSIWFKYNSGGLAAGDAYLFDQEGTSGNLQSLYYNDDSDLRFRNNGSTTISHPVNIEPDTWNFIAYTYDGTNEKLYLNGINVEKSSSGSDTDNANNTGIGTKRLGGGLWEGKIDDARIYNRALKTWEIFHLYQWGTKGRDMRKMTINKRGI